MLNYNKISYNIKSLILNFSEKISKDLSKLNYKFVCNMLYGLLESRFVLLSEISRQLNEPITLKKKIERVMV